jgi:tetratricopeptide (TPR) repeat protein
MKRIIVTILIFFAFLFISAGDKGFDYYINGEYENAWNHYLELFEQNDADPLASYNLAVISERFNKPGLAVYYYIQALQRAPGFSEAENNLSALSKEINITVPETLKGPAESIDLTLIVFFISLYLFAILFCVICFKPDWRIKIALIPVFLILLISASLYFIKYREAVNESWAVSVENATLHSGPDGSLTEVARLAEGEILVVETVSGEWMKVKGFNDNVEGWTEMRNIRRIIRGNK